jgi:hypothetical protein
MRQTHLNVNPFFLAVWLAQLMSPFDMKMGIICNVLSTIPGMLHIPIMCSSYFCAELDIGLFATPFLPLIYPLSLGEWVGVGGDGVHLNPSCTRCKLCVLFELHISPTSLSKLLLMTMVQLLSFPSPNLLSIIYTIVIPGLSWTMTSTVLSLFLVSVFRGLCISLLTWL